MMKKEHIEREAAKKEFLHAPMTEDEKILAIRRINSVPAADVVEVVRCRECIEFVKYRSAKGGLWTLWKWSDAPSVNTRDGFKTHVTVRALTIAANLNGQLINSFSAGSASAKEGPSDD